MLLDSKGVVHHLRLCHDRRLCLPLRVSLPRGHGCLALRRSYPVGPVGGLCSAGVAASDRRPAWRAV